MTGQLWLVSTPIGNLGDLPPRAVSTLNACALICCEDTRHSGKLLKHAGVAGVPLAVANEHTEDARVAQVLWDDLLEIGSWNKAKDVGKLRIEGKDYHPIDGDTMEFRFNV